MPSNSVIIEIGSDPSKEPLFRFSHTEIKHILISIIVLIIAFTFAFTNALYSLSSGQFNVGYFILMAIIVTVAVLTEFLLHELAHKFTAQKYGCWSEYRYTEIGLMLTLLTGFFGFVFAAPGVVWHSGHVTEKEEGKISAAGPVTNLGLAAIFFALWFLVPGAGFLSLLLWFVAWINVWVGAFNLIPIPPLDGSKIWKWSVAVYIGMWIGFILIGIGLYYNGFLSLF